MRLAHEKVREIARQKGTTLAACLRDAGVSRTAYYSLVRKDSVLPKSCHAVADALGVPVTSILEEPVVPLSQEVIEARLEEARAVCAEFPEANFENIWHVLTLEQLTPLERLNRSLMRGRRVAVQR
ncbi:hypothetical protein ABI59_19720 [Acidobacteria bacterium Mor1]|nr:hypothetical protein ABI59_19720 [Acidobacteria bacterium Mor1]